MTDLARMFYTLFREGGWVLYHILRFHSRVVYRFGQSVVFETTVSRQEEVSIGD